ncbi:MAG: flagellar biosynthetic protein FliP, partial [Spirochaetaceae bacterium]|nr:flagellar biosynthetic protein FliP [Spirochaetaceae bacterium]
MRIITKTFLIFSILLLFPAALFAQEEAPVPGGVGALPIPFVNLTVREPESNQETALSIQLLLFLTVISLAPSIAILMTSFLRISIVLDFVKRALSLQQVPPATVLMGIALFLTLFIMFPTFTEIYQEAFVPFADGTIETGELYDKA